MDLYLVLVGGEQADEEGVVPSQGHHPPLHLDELHIIFLVNPLFTQKLDCKEIRTLSQVDLRTRGRS